MSHCLRVQIDIKPVLSPDEFHRRLKDFFQQPSTYYDGHMKIRTRWFDDEQPPDEEFEDEDWTEGDAP